MKINKYNNSKPMSMEIVESLSEEAAPVEVQEEKHALSSIVSDLIQKGWESVDVVNGYMIAAQEIDSPELNKVLNMMLEDYYTQIGQLEGLMQSIVPEAEQIDQAKDTAEEVVDVEEF